MTEKDIADEVYIEPLTVPVLKKIIEKELCIEKDPVRYHYILLNECSHIQDISCRFYGRGFLLSDLQFLSF